MKSIKMTALISSAAVLFCCNYASGATREYAHNYKGVYVGVSSLLETYKQLGTPIKKEPQVNGKNYRYPKAVINFSGKQNGAVNTIIIDNDYEYTDTNGFKIGDSIEKLNAINKSTRGGSTIIDKEKGIVYWHDGKVIKRIVLASSLMVP